MNLGQSKNELRCAPRDDSIVVDLMKIAPLTAHDKAQALVERSLGALFELSSRGAADRVLDDREPIVGHAERAPHLVRGGHELVRHDPERGNSQARLDGLRNSGDAIRTIRVDSKVVRESDAGGAKSDADRWMRLTLDTVGKTDWPRDTQRRPIYPDGFEALAKKLERPLHPPGRDVRCIVSVGMLTEGWDRNTVTHIVGLRPFMSQLLCEQVVGRGLRRPSYAVGDDGKLGEEVAKIFGVPFEIVPLKENPAGNEPRPPPKTWPIHALPDRADLEIRFPRVERYMQRIRHRLKVDWDNIAPLCLDPMDIPPEVEMKAGLPSNTGRPALVGPGRLERVDLNPYRKGRRLQKLVFEMARDLTRDYRQQPHCDAPAHVLFPQIGAIVGRYLKEKVHAVEPAREVDAFLSPWYGWLVERLLAATRPDGETGEAAEAPCCETGRGPGSTAEVDFETPREPYPVMKSHVNAVVSEISKVGEAVRRAATSIGAGAVANGI